MAKGKVRSGVLTGTSFLMALLRLVVGNDSYSACKLRAVRYRVNRSSKAHELFFGCPVHSEAPILLAPGGDPRLCLGLIEA
jgi:hypothetical protein